ncbi:MAG: beta-ketoacyl-ACP synthase 3 [Pseudonocardiaceae bacterium]
MTSAIVGVGAALPERIVPNSYFAEHLDTSDEWIVKRTGIRERRWLDTDASLAELATRACRDALTLSGRNPVDVHHLVVATTTPDRITPGVAVEVAALLGMPRPAAFDLHAACAGFVYALDHACALIQTGRAECVLVCGAEALTRIIDRTDRSTAVLFGDAAGAVLLAAVPDMPEPSFALGSDGKLMSLLYVDRHDSVVRMRGSEIYEHAIEKMSHCTKIALDRRGLKISDIDLFIAHQANERIVRGAARMLEIPDDRLYLNVDRMANTSSASVPHQSRWRSRMPTRKGD